MWSLSGSVQSVTPLTRATVVAPVGARLLVSRVLPLKPLSANRSAMLMRFKLLQHDERAMLVLRSETLRPGNYGMFAFCLPLWIIVKASEIPLLI